MQVPFDAAWIRVRREVHVVAHLNRVFADVERRVSHLTHEVLVRHLKVLLLRLLVFALQGCEKAHLHILRYILMGLACKASGRAFLIVYLICSGLGVI